MMGRSPKVFIKRTSARMNTVRLSQDTISLVNLLQMCNTKLNKLSGLSSPPLPFTPLIILSSNELDGDMEAIRVAAPKAVVRGGVDNTWTLTNQNRVFVLDRCGRMVYQQSLQRSDTNLMSVQAAILSAHLDEPCGPCHLPSQQDELQLPNHGDLDQVEERPSSQSKMSGIANAYAPSNDAQPTSAVAHSTAEQDPHNTDETLTETTRQPERKKKKKKNNRKKSNKVKYQKEKTRKRVYEEALTSTSKPSDILPSECDCGLNDPNIDARGCECAGQYIPTEYDDRQDIQVPDSLHTLDQDLAILNEILEDRKSAFTLTSTDASVARSGIAWPTDRPEKKQKNGKRNRMDLQQEINEGIEIVREDEEIVEYPETIDFYVEVGDNVMTEPDQEDEGHLLGRGEHDLVSHGLNSEHGIMGNARDHLLGRGEHDLVSHGLNSEHGIMGNARDHLLGRGEHDLVSHGLNSEHGIMGNARDHLLGRGEHDLVSHGLNSEHGIMGNARDYLLGRGEHDLVSHGLNSEHGIMGNARDHLLGRGEHDLVSHGEHGIMGNARDHLLGRGEHDLVSHGQNSEHGIMGNARDHLLGRGEHDLVSHGLNREESIMGNERQGRSRTDQVFTDKVEADHDKNSLETYVRERTEDDKQREGEFWKIYTEHEKKKEKKTQDVPKKGNKGKKPKVESEEAENGAWVGSDEKTRVESEEAENGAWVGSDEKTRVESEEAANGAWVGSDETGSREFSLRWPTERPEGTVAVEETAAWRLATWRDATIAPTRHDSRSSGDSEDQARVVMYESEGRDQSQSEGRDQSQSEGRDQSQPWDDEKDALLHSKVQPWTKGKRY